MNQVYFPHYKEVRDASGETYILISHPVTQKAYKIKINDLLAMIAVNMISSDLANALDTGADGLLYVNNIYSADGVLAQTRTIDGDTNDLTIENCTLVDIEALTHVVLNATTGSDSGTVAANTTNAALVCTNGTLTSSIGAFANQVQINTATTGKLKIKDGLAPATAGFRLTLIDPSTGECSWQV